MVSRKLRVVDLFCGAGGLSLGFQTAGFEIVAGLDIDPHSRATFSQNLMRLQPDSRPTMLEGLSEEDGHGPDWRALRAELRPDVLIGGPPCQGFSRVGRAKLNSLFEGGFEAHPRNQLYRQFLAAAAAWRPLAVAMENVPGMLSVHGQNIAADAAMDLSVLGYEVGYAVLNAVWYGVPQYRERFFMVGIRDDLGIRPELPQPSHQADMPAGYVNRSEGGTLPLPFVKCYELPIDSCKADAAAVTVAEAIGDLPRLNEHLLWTAVPSRGDFRRPRNFIPGASSEYARAMRSWPGLGNVDTVRDHAIRYTPRDYETFRRMKQGDRYPEAHAIMHQRLGEALHGLGAHAPQPNTAKHETLKRSIIAPYPVEGFPDKWRKLIPDAPSWTVTAHLAKDSYSHIHYDDSQARAISIREAARLQSFPDGFAFSGNMGDCFRQIGNAVPPLVSRSIAEVLNKLLAPCSR